MRSRDEESVATRSLNRRMGYSRLKRYHAAGTACLTGTTRRENAQVRSTDPRVETVPIKRTLSGTLAPQRRTHRQIDWIAVR
jgi:hypothetical protein